jgi:hypothetical protein
MTAPKGMHEYVTFIDPQITKVICHVITIQVRFL